MVFQSYAIFPHLSVFENVAYGLRVQRLGKAEITERVERVLSLVELGGYGDRAPNQLSGGQQQRVALARALVMEPKVLLMDEPLSNLDAKLREQMRTEIRRIQQLLGITSIYVTHDQVEAMTMSDRIVVMNNGRIEQVGTPPEIYRTPRNQFVAGFIGRANFLPGTVTAVRQALVTVAVLGTEITMPAGAHALHDGQAVTLVIRPEMATINRGKPHVRGTVRRSTFLGDHLEYDVDIAGERLLLVENDPRHLALFDDGEEVSVHFLEECLYPLPQV